MRILLVNEWSPFGGGVETYVTLLAEALRGSEHDVRLLATAAGDGARADYVARSPEGALSRATLQLANPSAVRAARSALRDFSPDVALVSMFEFRLSPAVLAALRSIPVVLNIAYYKPICPTGLKLLPDGTICRERAGRVCMRSGCLGRAHWLRDQVRYGLIRRELERVESVITCSRHMEAVLAAEGIRARSTPWPVRPPGHTWRRRPSGEPQFAYVGRLAPEKGIELLLHAVRELHRRGSRVRLRVIGDGRERAALAATSRRLGLGDAVEFAGWASADEMDAALEDVWAVVVPSLWEEPFGLTAVEAVVRGIPVIAANAGGLPEIVEDGVTGLLVARADVAELADALEGVAAGRVFPELELPQEAVRRVRARHDLSRHVAWIVDVLSEAVGARATASSAASTVTPGAR